MFRFRFLYFKEKKSNEWIVKPYAWQKKNKIFILNSLYSHPNMPLDWGVVC